MLGFFSVVDVLPKGDFRHSVDYLTPGVLALAVMSTGMVQLAIGTAFERQYGVLKRLGATPLGRPRLLAAKTASMRADAADKRAGGAVKAVMTMALAQPSGGGSGTQLKLDTDATVMGRIGEFGQPIIKKKAEQMMNEFARNLEKAITDKS